MEKVIRPVSIYLTLPLIDRGIAPTTVTKVSLAFSTLGFFLLAFGGSRLVRLLGWAAIFAWVLLDHVDGNLARVKYDVPFPVCDAVADCPVKCLREELP